MPLEESLLVMQVMDKVREGGGFRYPEPLENVERRRFLIRARDFISNTDRLFQRRMIRKAKATLGMIRTREGEVRGGFVAFQFEIIERALLEILPLL